LTRKPLTVSRRDFLAAATATGALAATQTELAADRPKPPPFSHCFNTSTIRGQKLNLVDEIEIVAKAGYTGIELWMSFALLGHGNEALFSILGDNYVGDGRTTFQLPMLEPVAVRSNRIHAVILRR